LVQLLNRALTADIGGEAIGNPVKPEPTGVNDKTSAVRPWAVLLSDFHKADQRPSVVKKQAYAILRSWASPRTLSSFVFLSGYAHTHVSPVEVAFWPPWTPLT